MRKALVLFGLLMIFLATASCQFQPKCKKPMFSRARGKVSIGSQTYGSDIYFQIADNGRTPDDPHSGSNLYTGEIDLMQFTSPVTIKAQAVKDGYRNSIIAVEKFGFSVLDTLATDLAADILREALEKDHRPD